MIYLHAISSENNVEIGFSVQTNVDSYIFKIFHRKFFDLPEFGQERDDWRPAGRPAGRTEDTHNIQ